jgi:CubicO group peptidase (beta-lactamase class C family)
MTLSRYLPLVLLVSFVTAANAQPSGANVFEASVDEIMERFDTESTPGAVVAFVRDGRIEFSRAYGMASLTHGVPLSLDTPSNIGSTSKQFTAYAALLLERRGLLSLDDDIRTHLPALPDFGQTVTLRHLLTHTSGYREYVNLIALEGRRVLEGDQIAREELIEIINRQPELQSAPGAEFNYNNTGYGLVAMVLERVTGEDFGDWMKENVFLPAGMTSTVLRPYPGFVVPGRALGYVTGEREAYLEREDLAAAAGPGGIYATAGDMVTWMLDLGDPQSPRADLFREMKASTVLAAGDTVPYGLGLSIDTERGLRRIHHGGGDIGHLSHFAWYPDVDAGLVVLANTHEVSPAVRRLTDLFLGEFMADRAAVAPVTEFDPTTFEPALFDAYAGRYELDVAPGFILSFRRENGRFLARATGQSEFSIVPISDSTFALTVVDASITFHRDADGTVRSLTLHQNGHHRANRLMDAPPEMDLHEFTGRYFSEELETFYTLIVEDGALLVRHRRLDDIRLIHGAGDSFAGSFPLMNVTFDRNEAGGVIGLRAGNGRARDVRFVRLP